MVERHVLCCDCDDCLGPGIPMAPLPKTPTRMRFGGKPLPSPKPELLEPERFVTVSPEIAQVKRG